MKKKKILTLVVTYNRKELLVETLTALLNQESQTDILVVDNASTDGTFDYLQPFVNQKQITYVNTGENLGGAGGFNFALKYAAELDYDYFWLMDDDTIVHESSLSTLLDACDSLDDEFGFLSSYVQFTTGETCKMNIQGLARDWYKGLEKRPGLLKVNKATFVSFFIKKETVFECGLPIKEFFIWADDSEYSLRISKKWPSYMVLDSLITHKMLVNADANHKVFIGETTERYSRYYYSFRNNFYIAKQQGLGKVLHHVAKLMAVFLLVLVKSKAYRFRKAKLVLKGLVDGLLFNPKIEYIEGK